MALAERLLNARLGDAIVDHHTYVIAGDGCLMEGISHEAISLAGHLRLDKLIVLFDDNQHLDRRPTIARRLRRPGRALQGLGLERRGASTATTPRRSRRRSNARARSDKPTLIACKTTIGYGAPTKAGKASTHGEPLGDEEIKGARDKLGWPHAPFEVPADVLAAWRAVRDARRGRARGWKKRWRRRSTPREDARRSIRARRAQGRVAGGHRGRQERRSPRRRPARRHPRLVAEARSSIWCPRCPS